MPSILNVRSACLLLLYAAAGLSGCRQAGQTNNEAVENAAVQAPANLAAEVPLPQPPMDRAALLQAVAQARSAAAMGTNDVGAQRALDGKQFEVRVRFGCEGAAASLDDATLGWTYDPGKSVLRIRARPTISDADPVAVRIKPAEVEAVEGFWLPKPWLLQAACPAKPIPPAGGKPDSKAAVAPARNPKPEAAVPPAAAPRVGIAQFFTVSDPRTTRRDRRPYEATRTLHAGAHPGTEGFDLVLEGRLRSSGDGRVILCSSSGRDLPPDCIISARVDRVRFEEPDTGETIAEWGSS